MSTVEEIAEAIKHLDVAEQMRLLRELPAHLKISPEDIARWKMAESAFGFWDNADDAAYDKV